MTTEQNDFSGGHTPLTPPPASGTQPAPQAPSPEMAAPPATGRSAGSKAVMIVTAIVGGIAILGSGGAAAAAAAGSIMSSSTPDSVQTVSTEGLTGIDVSADASSMRVEYGNVDEARLAITNGRGAAWTFERDGDELVVRSPQGVWGWWFGSWFGDEEVAVLTLPESLQGEELDADLTLNAGSLDVVGEFGALDIDVNAGALDVRGTATGFDVQMSAGRADVLLDGVDEADLGVSAGDLTVELTGTAPRRTAVDVSAGSVDLTVPDVEYDLTQDVSAGSLDAKVQQSSNARRTIDVTLEAGRATIRPGR
ncbi:DUF4097 domain-containing protein [Microbacterium sp. SSW1-49]|uniref:DUF4097 domain-containing protein n=1 Tax=Microbacterium croceum TaxID=2851645 RepID=A0ABT0FAE9_9MICO|nr:DUF4097 domain-containing protein [Microbacterium croceum]MCK2035038.1 DUF4097 domain-containing protein [Microbacterium croceum]